MKQVMIPQQLFLDLVIHHVLDMPGYEERIRQGLSDKMDAILRREWFTQYRTAPDEASRRTSVGRSSPRGFYRSVTRSCERQRRMILAGGAGVPVATVAGMVRYRPGYGEGLRRDRIPLGEPTVLCSRRMKVS